ncbi:MAG: SusC/RagA family TonB-linked outer membrane protein, partial [Paludibacter sp.]|nr:SusC/RagA family TonB-linked outer membrane protein [Paludibacter sp.]
VDEYKSEIAEGKIPVYVNSYSTGLKSEQRNLEVAKIRASRVKSELITVKGLKEDNFVTKLFAQSYEGQNAVVTVTLLVKSEITKQTPQEELKPAIEQPKEEPKPVVVEKPKEEPKVTEQPKEYPKPVISETPIEKQEGYITGKITDAATGKAIAGARIDVPQVASAISEDDGSYSIKLLSDKVVLQVSGFGYAQRDVPVRGRENIDIALYETSYKGAQTSVYTPTGEVSSTQVANSWTVVRENTDISVAVTPDVLLQGYASGVNTVFRSGLAGNSANMFLHGFNTLNAGTMPFIVVDGIPYENTRYSTSLIGNYQSNPLASIDIKDIESITILKDGASVYGVKGANGVVLIKTKKAQQLETKINAHVHTGINFEPIQLPVMNAAQHKNLLADIQQTNPALTSAQINALPYFDNTLPVKHAWGWEGNTDYYRYNHNTNWQDEIYNNASFNQDYYINISGGDEVATYMLSLGFLNQQGTLKNTNFQQLNTRFNSEIHLSKDVDFQANMSFISGTKNLINEGGNLKVNPMLAALVKSPFTAIHRFNAENQEEPNLEDVDVFGNSNPYVLANNLSLVNVNFRFLGSFGLNWRLNKETSINGIFGLNFNKEREKVFYSGTGVAFDLLKDAAIINKAQHSPDRLFSLYSDIYADYRKHFSAVQQLSARVGLRYQTNKSEDDDATAYNSPSDDFKSVQYGVPLLNQIGGSIGEWRWMSLYANVDYALQNKYFLNAQISGDATSRSGADAAPMFVYPSVAAAWLVSGEDFYRGNDLLKLRASYGLSGNDEIGNYSAKHYYVPQNILGSWGLIRGNLVNKELKPETVERINLGFDMSFANERINVSIDFYHNTVRDMILHTQPPRQTGFDVYLDNAGSMRNIGADLTLNARIINATFKWDLGVTAAAYKNTVLSLDGAEYYTDILGATVQTKEGQPLGVFYGYRTDGVYAAQTDAAADGLRMLHGLVEVPFGMGDMRFVNQNDDKMIDGQDRVVIGNPNPDLFGSVSNTFKYKQWTLSALMIYSLGNDVYNYTRSQLENGSTLNNQSLAMLNRWRAEGDVTAIPRVAYGDPMGNARFSDRWIEDGSYIRLKTVTLSYDLDLKLNFIQSCTLFATAENLLTLTRYKGLDPEFAAGQNPLYYGIDAGVVPQPKTVSVGVKLAL